MVSMICDAHRGRGTIADRRVGGELAYLVAALCSAVWQKRKRTSFRVWVKAYLADMLAGGYQLSWLRWGPGQLVDWRLRLGRGCEGDTIDNDGRRRPWSSTFHGWRRLRIPRAPRYVHTPLPEPGRPLNHALKHHWRGLHSVDGAVTTATDPVRRTDGNQRAGPIRLRLSPGSPTDTPTGHSLGGEGGLPLALGGFGQ